ncbi:MAG TPA: ATP-binding cassette domain-containing protein [Thermoanaerobaculia bacterium]|jgi:molybdate transport system ATP-binding protein|nr:ATP-binding cassette domain-containing protein [Thermoanaerobaculia bacterium]
MGVISASVRLRRGDFAADVRFESDARALAIFGASGAGKTTFLDGVAGVRRPEEGRIEVRGSTLFDSDARIDVPPRRRRVGYVRQAADLFPAMTVGENIAFASSCRTGGGSGETADALAVLGVAPLRERRPRELSGGEMRRVQIARALASSPEILLLDEPFANLDAAARREILPLLARIPRLSGVPTVLVTHDVEEVFAFADEVVVFEGGRAVAQGEPLATLSRPGSWAVARIAGVENFLRGRVRGAAAGGGTLVEWEGAVLRAPEVQGAEGAEVTLALFAEDVLIARGPIEGLSARNALPMRVDSVDDAGDSVLVMLSSGPRRLQSRVTRDALSALRIVPGAEVAAVFKSASLRVLEGLK